MPFRFPTADNQTLQIVADMLIQEIQQAIQASVQDVLETGAYRAYLSEHSQQLVCQLQATLASEHWQLCSSGTAALEILLRAMQVESGDEVLICAYDYPGNFWAIERTGARPVLVDTAPASWNLDVDQLGEAVRGEHRCKALIVSHLHSSIQDTRPLRAFCDRHNLFLIEDCCQAIGSRHEGTLVGQSADAGVISFGGGKLISCGRGGALFTSDEKLAQRAKIASGAGSGPYELSELQAAVVSAQLPFLEPLMAATCSFFESVDHEVVARGSSRLARPESVDYSTIAASIYQAGWLINAQIDPSQGRDTGRRTLDWEQSSSDVDADSLPTIGVGFPGFHRRSKRRCRHVGTLSNVRNLADSIRVVSHRIALEQNHTPSEVAEALLRSY
jgi:perosamine synthetase